MAAARRQGGIFGAMSKLTSILICAVVVAGGAFAQSTSGSKASQEAKAKPAPAKDCCAELAKAAQDAKPGVAQDCCEAESAKTAALAQEDCCKSTDTKPMKKGDPGCCNEKGALAKFKVYLSGGYKFFGCEGSAKKAREEMLSKGLKPGPVQKVTSKVKIA